MSTHQERCTAFHITRVIIFIMASTATLVESPLTEILAIISLAMWLWLPQLIKMELRGVKYIKRTYIWNCIKNYL